MSEQKVAVVTGASQGIGEGIVAGFRKAGYQVVANSRSITEGDDPGVLAVPGDIADPATAEQIVGQAVAHFGRVDTLVNNAGIFLAKPFTEFDRADYERFIGVNLTGFFGITQRVVARLLEQGGGGHIVTITATLAEHPTTSVPSVLAALTKGGLNAATRSLAIEYSGRGIRANAVSPGVIATPMHDPGSHEALGDMHPLGHIGRTGDVVDAVLYLENAPFVTGEILHVDGGQIAGH
jgi:NAD(P)-dependent dehydrogenase (short-subunit alcohol dehydrogenase family)